MTAAERADVVELLRVGADLCFVEKCGSGQLSHAERLLDLTPRHRTLALRAETAVGGSWIRYDERAAFLLEAALRVEDGEWEP